MPISNTRLLFDIWCLLVNKHFFRVLPKKIAYLYHIFINLSIVYGYERDGKSLRQICLIISRPVAG